MTYLKLITGCLVAVLFVLTYTSRAYANPLSFFPSSEIHEDDGISGEFHLQASNCSFKLTKYFPNHTRTKRITITIFDLAYFETDPMFVNPPYFNARLSTRHTVAWFARSVINTDLENVQSPLREARLSLIDRRKLTSEPVIQKRLRLASILKRIENDEYGHFAARNHSKTFAVNDKLELIAVTVSSGFWLPIERDNARQLIKEMNDYRLKNCSTIVSN